MSIKNTREELVEWVEYRDDDERHRFEAVLRTHEKELVKRVIAWSKEKRVGVTDPGHWGPNCEPPHSNIPDEECVLKSIESEG